MSETETKAPTEAELADLIGEGLGIWREKQGREPTEAEGVAIATLALGTHLATGEPSPVSKGRRLRGRFFRPADERRHRATLDTPPRSPQAARIRAKTDKRIEEGHLARD